MPSRIFVAFVQVWLFLDMVHDYLPEHVTWAIRCPFERAEVATPRGKFPWGLHPG